MMKKEKKERIMNCTSFDELLNERCGCEEMPEWNYLNVRPKAFCLAGQFREKRHEAGLIQGKSLRITFPKLIL